MRRAVAGRPFCCCNALCPFLALFGRRDVETVRRADGRRQKSAKAGNRGWRVCGGVNFAIPVPLSYYTFGGWKRSGFGDLNQHGPDSIHFYTKTKTVTARWPSGVKEGAEFVIPTMR